MERLTNKKEADAQRIDYETRLKNGYPRNIPEERFLRLAAYEDIGLTPERCAELAKADRAGRLAVLSEVDDTPAADVVPVRHGQWEQFRLGADDYVLRLRCSCCRKVVYERGFHFCPGCGADMRGADNEK